MADQREPGGVGRREFLRNAGLLGAASMMPSLLVACSSDSGTTTTAAGAVTTTAPQGGIATTTSLAGGVAAGILRVRTWGGYSGVLDPMEIPTFLEFQTLAPVVESLVGWIPGTADVVNVLAESLDASDDGLAYEFTLKGGIPFHGGYGEVTAEDVKFSLERAAASEFAVSRDQGLGRIASVEVTGPLSGVIRLTGPYALFATSTLARWSSGIVSQAAVNDLGDLFRASPICTGPYRVIAESFQPDSGLTLARFEEYGGAASDQAPIASYDEIVYNVVIDDNPAVIALETGELTYSWLGGTSVGQFEGVDGFRVDPSNLLGWNYMGMNVQHRLLSDVNLRKAVRWGIDSQEIIDGALAGRGQPTNFLLPEGMLGFWPEAPVYTRDLERARELFEAGGAPTDELEILVEQAQVHRSAAEIISEQLREVGFNTVVRVVDSAAVQQYRQQDPPSADSAFHYSTAIYLGFDPADTTLLFTSSRIGTTSASFWSSERYDELWAEGLVETDPARREEIYVEMQQIFDEEMPQILVSTVTQWYAGRDTIEPSFHAIGFPLYHFFGGSI